MAEDSKSYKITNTTVKEPYKKNGRDQRTPMEQKGHMVSWQDNLGNPVGVGPKQMKVVQGPLSSDIFRLAARGLIAIEEIGDISTAIKQFEEEARQSTGAKKDHIRDEDKRAGKQDGASATTA